MTGPPAAFLDACVLYPPGVRLLLLGAAAAGLFRPLWSARVLEEWRRAVAAKAPAGLAAAEAEIGALVSHHPAALVPPAPGLEARLALPDPADAHVAAAAAAAGAGAIVSFNVADFPPRALAPLGLAARHPDGFLWELQSAAPDAMGRVIDAAFPGLDGPTRRRALKRSGLPRLGKAARG